MNPAEEQEFLKRYAYLVGSLVINFQSLELAIRAFLQAQPGAEPIGLPYGADFYAISVGTIVPLCPITSQDSLQDLIGKFNRIANDQGKPRVDPDLADVRDALGHGRNSATMEGVPMRSIKYSAPRKPDKKTVKVTFNAVLDENWFKQQRGRVLEALSTVHNALTEIGAGAPTSAP